MDLFIIQKKHIFVFFLIISANLSSITVKHPDSFFLKGPDPIKSNPVMLKNQDTPLLTFNQTILDKIDKKFDDYATKIKQRNKKPTQKLEKLEKYRTKMKIAYLKKTDRPKLIDKLTYNIKNNITRIKEDTKQTSLKNTKKSNTLKQEHKAFLSKVKKNKKAKQCDTQQQSLPKIAPSLSSPNPHSNTNQEQLSATKPKKWALNNPNPVIEKTDNPGIRKKYDSTNKSLTINNNLTTKVKSPLQAEKIEHNTQKKVEKKQEKKIAQSFRKNQKLKEKYKNVMLKVKSVCQKKYKQLTQKIKVLQKQLKQKTTKIQQLEQQLKNLKTV